MTPEQLKRYTDMRTAGESHSIAEILATRSFPGVRTDSVFNAGRTNGSQFEAIPDIGDYYKRVAEAHGQSVTGKTYLSQLARFPGDPEAWVNGRGDVERVCRERGYQCEGLVHVESGERPPRPDVDIDPVLVDAEVDEIMEGRPDLKREDVYETVKEVRSGHVDPNPQLVHTPPPNDLSPDF